MRKRVLAFLLIFAFIIEGISMITGYTLVIPYLGSHTDSRVFKQLKKGDKINVFENLDFSKGNCKAYLVISRSDFNDLNKSIKKATCLKTTDKVLLQEMKKNLLFTYTDGDVATVESAIYIYCDNKLVFESGIVLDKYSEGLQSKYWGWITPVQPNLLSSYCKQFKRVYWPIVFL